MEEPMSDEVKVNIIEALYDQRSETALLGDWLSDDKKSSCYLQTKTEIAADDFYLTEHVDIARAIEAVVSSGKRADPVTVGAELTKQGKLDSVGGYAYLQKLIDLHYTDADSGTYAEIIREKAQRRNIARVTRAVHEQSFDLAFPNSSLRETLSQVLVDGGKTGSRTMEDLCLEELSRVLDRDRLKKERESWPRSRIKALDDIIDGFRPGRFGILAGSPGVGKSSLAGWILLKNAACDRHIPCAFISLEMPEGEVVQRLAYGESGVENGRIDRLDVGERELSDYQKALNTLSGLPIHVFDSTRCRAVEDDVLNAVQQAAVVDHCKLIVVDYFQLIQSNKGNLTRAEELSRLAARFKVMAVRWNVYILALSQVSREAVKQGSVLKMQDLKDSSGLEQAADDIILLSEAEGSTPERGVLLCIVDKHRSGKTGRCGVEFDKLHQTWSSAGGAPALEEGKHGRA
jgi:replicative DNA helicase